MSTFSVMLASLAGLTLAPAAELPSETLLVQDRVIHFTSEQLLAEDGVEALRHRIALSARMVCRESGNPLSRMGREARACIDNAYRDGVEQLEIKVAEARETNRQYALTSTDSARSTH